jgi:hypothetical protein
MTFIRDDQIQAAFLADMKGRTNITAEVAAAQIKETQPQTTEFTYPAIRIRVNNDPNELGCGQNATIQILCFSEEFSSQQVMRIAGIIQSEYHDKSFSETALSQQVRFTSPQAVTVPAVRQDRNTWRSEVLLNVLVSSG